MTIDKLIKRTMYGRAAFPLLREPCVARHLTLCTTRRGAISSKANPFGESGEHRFLLIESSRELIKESILELKCLQLLFQFFPFKVHKRSLVTQVTSVLLKCNSLFFKLLKSEGDRVGYLDFGSFFMSGKAHGSTSWAAFVVKEHLLWRGYHNENILFT
jgi:hypothetical protein